MIEVLQTIHQDRFSKIEELLNNITFPVHSVNNRAGFPKHRSFVIGLTKHRCHRYVMPARLNDIYPELLDELFKLGDEICPFNFTSVYVNKNVVSPKHKDSNNIGESLIVSLGNYTGCNLVIDNKIYDAKYTPIIFNGAELEHYNINNLVGTKYSLIFYTVLN
jgi:hypothetical protein